LHDEGFIISHAIRVVVQVILGISEGPHSRKNGFVVRFVWIRSVLVMVMISRRGYHQTGLFMFIIRVLLTLFAATGTSHLDKLPISFCVAFETVVGRKKKQQCWFQNQGANWEGEPPNDPTR
jgi:hypothetical protein